MIVTALCLLWGVLFLVHVYYRYSRGGRLIQKLKGPKGVPFLGNAFDMYQTPETLFTKFREWHKEFGHMWKLSGLNYRTVHLYRPQDVEIIMSASRYNDKALPYTFLYPWLREGLLVSKGKKWLERRKMLTPAFHFNILMKFFKSFNDSAQDLVDGLEREVGKEKTDVMALTSRTTLKIMCETSMGTKLRIDTPDVRNYLDTIHEFGVHVMRRLTSPWLYVDFIYQLSSLSKTVAKKGKNLQEFTRKIIKERRENYVDRVDMGDGENIYGSKTRLAMLDLLLDEEKKGKIDDRGIGEEVDTFLFEGHDTTATALSFAIMKIANEPQIQNLIYKELQDIFGDSDRPAVFEDMSKMKYLECCIKETLRLYPSVPFVSRYLSEEVVIDGKCLPANTFYDIHIYDIHRDPELYPEPEKFIPERFLAENSAKRHPYAYIPFSAGPRNCIGQKFAMMELKTVLSGILRKYTLEPVTRTEDLVFMADLVLRTNHPVYVRFCRRNI